MSTKTQLKAAAKTARQSKPLAKIQGMPKPEYSKADIAATKALHSLISVDYRAMLGENKAGMTAYTAFRAVVEAAPLSDAKALTSMLQDMKLTFGEQYVDKYVLRMTIINNARKVVHGGTKDKHVIQGRGRAALIEALDSVSSIRELRKAMSAAKPEALKEVKSATGPKAAAKPVDAVKKAVDTGKLPASAPDAFKAARAILKALESFFVPSQTEQLAKIEATIAMLTQEEVNRAKPVKKAA